MGFDRSATTGGGLSLSEEAKGGEAGAYSQIVFVQWNYSQNEVECVNLQHQSIYSDIIVSRAIIGLLYTC